MSTWYQPEKVLVCVRLAGDHQAGLLLAVSMRRYPYAKATLESTDGTWSANPRTVLFVRPTKYTQMVWHAAITFEALDALVGT